VTFRTKRFRPRRKQCRNANVFLLFKTLPVRSEAGCFRLPPARRLSLQSRNNHNDCCTLLLLTFHNASRRSDVHFCEFRSHAIAADAATASAASTTTLFLPSAATVVGADTGLIAGRVHAALIRRLLFGHHHHGGWMLGRQAPVGRGRRRGASTGPSATAAQRATVRPRHGVATAAAHGFDGPRGAPRVHLRGRSLGWWWCGWNGDGDARGGAWSRHGEEERTRITSRSMS